jgi:hypothetical protein
MQKLRLAAFAALATMGSFANAELIYGATSTQLFTFDSSNPTSQTTVGNFSGLTSGHTVRAIDFRPANGQLYVVSSSGNSAQLYTANLSNGALTAVGAGFLLGGYTGTRVSVDFNPTVDRIRVVTGGGQNLRVNPITGLLAATDTSLAFATGDVNAAITPLISGVAYTNNVAGATSTTLYGYDYSTDSLVTIGGLNSSPSPNGGQIFTVGQSFTPPITSAASQGFDISGTTGVAYLQSDKGNSGEDFFYTVNLTTGSLTEIGSFGRDVLDISATPVPEPATLITLGLGALSLRRRNRRA